jgi:hypothetical protein
MQVGDIIVIIDYSSFVISSWKTLPTIGKIVKIETNGQYGPSIYKINFPGFANAYHLRQVDIMKIG